MAAGNTIQANALQSTLSRLQALKDLSTFDVQIYQAAHIIGLPDDWNTIEDEETQVKTIERVVRARSEWVLRWILEKMKDDTEAGKANRSTVAAWRLLDWMVHILPISRSTPHLRDASFVSILERTLYDLHDKSMNGHDMSSNDDVQMPDLSDSSATLQEAGSSLRKRKRGSEHTVALRQNNSHPLQYSQLFLQVYATLGTISKIASNKSPDHVGTQAELMKTILRTDSAQASRILGFWLRCICHIIAEDSTVNAVLDLTLVLQLWDLRATDPRDIGGASVEDFSAECLVPTLATLDLIRGLQNPTIELAAVSMIVVSRAAESLDTLLVKHLLSPSRAVFLLDTTSKPSAKPQEAKSFSEFLRPLEARLLQAAQVEDSSETVTAELQALFDAVPHLLDLTIRASPSRTPKGRLIEKPWIQTAFQVLAECTGCLLSAPPTHVTHRSAAGALEGLLRILKVQSVSVEFEILKKVFWYHCGFRYPEHQNNETHWPLVATLIELNPSGFITESRPLSDGQQAEQTSLANHILERLSNENGSIVKQSNKHMPEAMNVSAAFLMTRIVVPLMVAFASNRKLLKFIQLWDDQLISSYTKRRHSRLGTSLWEDASLSKALMQWLEKSLVQDQIQLVIAEHAKRISRLVGNDREESTEENMTVSARLFSSSVIISAVLQSVDADDNVASLESSIASLFASYTNLVQKSGYAEDQEALWLMLCQLLAKLWPLNIHSSLELQRVSLYSLINYATKQVCDIEEDKVGGRSYSSTRSAAALFSLMTCSYLQPMRQSKEIIQMNMLKVINSMLSDDPSSEDPARLIEHFCVHFVTLLDELETEPLQGTFQVMIEKVAKYATDEKDLVCLALPQSIFDKCSKRVQHALCESISEVLRSSSEESARRFATRMLFGISPCAIPRQIRESILDWLVDHAGAEIHDLNLSLSVMSHLQEVPNATARISSNPVLVTGLAEHIHARDCQLITDVKLLQRLMKLTLSHIMPNHMQSQNKEFLDGLTKTLERWLRKPESWSNAKLVIVCAVISEQKSIIVLDPKLYLEMLKHRFTEEDYIHAQPELQSIFLDALNELSPTYLEQHGLWDFTREWLQYWVDEYWDWDAYITSSERTDDDMVQFMVRAHTTIAKFNMYTSANWLIDFTLRLAQEPTSRNVQGAALQAMKDAILPLSTSQKLDLITTLIGKSGLGGTTACYMIMNDVIGALDNKLVDEPDIKQKQLALLAKIAFLLAETSEFVQSQILLNMINTILNDKPILTSQRSIECVFSVLVKVVSRSSPIRSVQDASKIFSSVCKTTHLLLVLHRGRLGGRFHLLLPLLQGLLFCLFIPHSGSRGALPAWLRATNTTEPIRLTPANAGQYSRLLSTLCHPPLSSITKAHQHHASRKSKELNDPVKTAREKTSQFLYPLLSLFCRFQLSGRLDQQVRQKLMPGMWDALDTASLHKSGLDAMFAGLPRSEKDVWRGVWSEWESRNGRGTWVARDG